MGWFGLENGKAFGVAPGWVDVSKPPGWTSDSAAYGSEWATVQSILTLDFFFKSPNFVWFFITVLVYIFAPYDLEAAKSSEDWLWCTKRLAVNTLVHTVFCGFWSITLFKLQWAKRKFKPASLPTPALLLHNFVYSWLGVLQWTVWECVFMHLWASGQVDFIPDEEVGANPLTAVWFIVLVLAIPVVREFHFYIGHRFIHVLPLYKFIHVVHHRNVDVEPFSGLAMSPAEHLYYLSGGALMILIRCSPFHFLWVGQHALISPAAAHSGFEDAWQSDQFHYIHHASFSCNFGGWSIPVDKWFGTHRDKLERGEEDDVRKGIYVPATKSFTNGRTITAADCTPSKALVVYNSVLCIPLALVWWARTYPQSVWFSSKTLVSAFFSLAPVLVAVGLYPFFFEKSWRAHSWRYPFHKEPLIVFWGHVILALYFAVYPVFLTCLAFIDSGQLVPESK